MNKNEIHELLTTYKGETIDLCAYIYSKIHELSSEEQIEAFQNLCEMYGKAKSIETYTLKKVISETEKEMLIAQYGDYVN